MPRLPWIPLLAVSTVFLWLACRGDGASVAATAGIPFVRPAAVDSFVMVSEASDTLWFRSYALDEESVRLVRYRRALGGFDSLSATVDARTLAAVASHDHRRTAGGPLTADVAYGAGFEGQARLTLASSAGDLADNLRTPPPFLDAAQIPQSFAALDFGAPDTITFNYIAPFNKRALNAQLVLGRLDTIDLPRGPTAAYPVELRVSGLEERFWISTSQDGYRLLRWRDVTRGVTWTRIEPTAR